VDAVNIAEITGNIAVIGYGIAAIGPGIGVGMVVSKNHRVHRTPTRACRSPAGTMWLGIAFVEALALIGLAAGFIFV